MTRKDLLIQDLSKFYRDRLQRITDDITDTALRSRMPTDEIAALIVRNLIGVCAVVVIETGGSKEDFLDVCGGIYNEMKGRLRRGKN
jgi:hypothetical protein